MVIVTVHKLPRTNLARVGPFFIGFASGLTRPLLFSKLGPMPTSKQPSPDDTLEQMLDRVSNAREELVAIERSLERLRADISKSQKGKGGSGKTR
jgi:hypothetical protein